MPEKHDKFEKISYIKPNDFYVRDKPPSNKKSGDLNKFSYGFKPAPLNSLNNPIFSNPKSLSKNPMGMGLGYLPLNKPLKGARSDLNPHNLYKF